MTERKRQLDGRVASEKSAVVSCHAERRTRRTIDAGKRASEHAKVKGQTCGVRVTGSGIFLAAPPPSDAEWLIVEPMIPPAKRGGKWS